MAKERLKNLKLSKVSVFCLLVNEWPIKMNRITSNQKLIIEMNEK